MRLYGGVENGKVVGCDNIPDPIPQLHVGCGYGSFIGLCAWLHAFHASWCYQLRWAVPSPDEAKSTWFQRNARLPEDCVGTDLKAMLKKAIADCKAQGLLLPVVTISTPTAQHKQNLLDCIAAGIKFIVIDKPITMNWQEFCEVYKAAKENDVTIIVTFNHSSFTAIRQMAHIVKGVTPRAIKRLRGKFNQSWVVTDPGIQQSRHRFEDPWFTANDLGTHVFNGLEVIAGEPAVWVENGIVGTMGDHGHDVIDNGSCVIGFESGLTAEIGFTNVLPLDEWDHLAFQLSTETGEHYLWDLQENPDALYVSRLDGNWNDRGQWHPHFRGASPLIYGSNAAMYSKGNPAAHTEGWDPPWESVAQAAAGNYHRINNHPSAADQPPRMKGEVATYDSGAMRAVKWVECLVASAAAGGKRVNFSEYQLPA